MYKNFYNNPLGVIWRSRKTLLSKYLWCAWIIIFLGLIWGTYCKNIANFKGFNVANYFTASLTGLTFTLALFIAESKIFSEKELKILAVDESKGKKGQVLIEFFGPFVFTGIVFLITGTISLIVPYINIKLSAKYGNMLILIYLAVLMLGLFSLFNLIMNVMSDNYYSVTSEEDGK